MKQVRIGNTVLGDGRVKICLPLVGSNRSEIEAQLYTIAKHEPDLIEFRADWYESVFEKAKLYSLLEEIRQLADKVPVLFTFRSKSEGGERNISWETYQELNLYAAESGLVDAVDVEAFFNYITNTGRTLETDMPNAEAVALLTDYRDKMGMEKLISDLQRYSVKVIASNHDFLKTPSKEQLIARLACMQRMGADIAKIAVMPEVPEDVLTLLCATREMEKNHPETPVITMSMGRLGVLSRMGGGLFGSALTFASAGKASAPGQVEVEQLRGILKML